MPDDAVAREVVRRLMKLADHSCAQSVALCHVLAKRDAKEYERLLGAAEKFVPKALQIRAIADELHGKVYQALDDPNADWSKAVSSWLSQEGPIVLNIKQGDEILRLLASGEDPEPG